MTDMRTNGLYFFHQKGLIRYPNNGRVWCIVAGTGQSGLSDQRIYLHCN